MLVALVLVQYILCVFGLVLASHFQHGLHSIPVIEYALQGSAAEAGWLQAVVWHLCLCAWKR